MDQIDAGLLLSALRKLEVRGAVETARRSGQRAERVFESAAAAGVRTSNPAVNLGSAPMPVPTKRRPAVQASSSFDPASS